MTRIGRDIETAVVGRVLEGLGRGLEVIDRLYDARRFSVSSFARQAPGLIARSALDAETLGGLARRLAARPWPGFLREIQVNPHLVAILGHSPELHGPTTRDLLSIVVGETRLNRAGYPEISREGFETFRDRVPHLFKRGAEVLQWIERFEDALKGDIPMAPWTRASLVRGAAVIRTMVQTAALTAPTDLWIARQLIDFYAPRGVLDRLEGGVSAGRLAAERGWDRTVVEEDLRFLWTRGYLERSGDLYRSEDLDLWKSLRSMNRLPEDRPSDPAVELRAWFEGDEEGDRRARFERWLDRPRDLPGGKGWIAGPAELEIGYRLVPLVLALSSTGRLKGAVAGTPFAPPSNFTDSMHRLVEDAGLVSEGRLTSLSARVFARAAGPFGILYAYRGYFTDHTTLLKGGRPPVVRADDITATRLAHHELSGRALDALEAFCRDWGYRYNIFIEHALGLGPGTALHWERYKKNDVDYIGVDAEEAALELARDEKRAGRLPTWMDFLAADIGDADRLIAFIGRRRINKGGAVMMVNAGFEEIRDPSGRRLEQTLATMADAGIALVTTETPLLRDEALRASAWQTFHAGFRYVQNISGQVLRTDAEFRRILARAGYVVLERYSPMGRRTFPYPRPDAENPPISATYLAVPRRLALKLGIPKALWT